MDPGEEPKDITETQEYKDLFERAKAVYPDEYDYIIHLACLSHLKDLEQDDKKSDINIEI